MKGAFQRPKMLAAVQELGALHGNIDGRLREFLDEFYTAEGSEARQHMLYAEPSLSANEKVNAYLAATAEHPACEYGLHAPAWIEGESRFRHEACFPCGLESLKPILPKESPPASRRRMIFVDSDPLYRPRKDHPVFGM